MAGPWWCVKCSHEVVEAEGNTCEKCARAPDDRPRCPECKRWISEVGAECVVCSGKLEAAAGNLPPDGPEILEDLTTSPLVCPHCSETIEGVEIPNPFTADPPDGYGYEAPGSPPPLIPDELMKVLEGYLQASTKDRKPPCGEHAFERLHKDETHAVIFCMRCGLFRVLEMALTEDGRMPILDIPTPLMLDADDWPKLGVGLGRISRHRAAVVLLNRTMRVLGKATNVPEHEAMFKTLYEDIEEYQAAGEE